MVAGALKGMGAVSAGLIIGSALKLMPTLKSNPIGVPGCAIIAVIAFTLVALLRWPLAWVLLALGIVACCYAAVKIKAQTTTEKSTS